MGEPAFATFHLVGGRYELDVPCPACGAEDGLKGYACYPGKWPQCWRCGVKILRFGKTPAADCVTPNGRVDSHLKMIRRDVCAFCGKR